MFFFSLQDKLSHNQEDKLNLQFKVNKDGSNADLLNWEDARNVIKKTFESSIDGLTNKYSKDGKEKEDADTIKNVFSPFEIQGSHQLGGFSRILNFNSDFN